MLERTKAEREHRKRQKLEQRSATAIQAGLISSRSRTQSTAVHAHSARCGQRIVMHD